MRWTLGRWDVGWVTAGGHMGPPLQPVFIIYAYNYISCIIGTRRRDVVIPPYNVLVVDVADDIRRYDNNGR